MTGAAKSGEAESGIERWDVPGALDGERLDRALALMSGLSRRHVNDLLDAGRVRVGRQPVSSHHRKVRTGERVSVAGPIAPPPPDRPVADPAVDVPVVWSDDEVIVVDKPAGLVVHPGAGNRTGTLMHGLLARFGQLADSGDPDRPGIVHRLDKGTSGLMVVARTTEAHQALVEQLSRRHVEREYTALAAGIIEEDEGLVDAPLARGDRDPTLMRVQAGGRQARTRYRVDERFGRPVLATLLSCRLETGRTHQIRVHLASIGHPIVGDDRYGRPVDGWQPLPPGRPFLHAVALTFDHPRTAQRLSFSSPLPEDLLSVIAGMTDLAPP
jgi:23S rRNA pseudouridine1911/1915/1917 synthase